MPKLPQNISINSYADLKCVMGDVVDVHGENMVFAAHVHPVLILVHVQDPVVHGLVWNTVVFKGLGGLQVCETEERGQENMQKRF